MVLHITPRTFPFISFLVHYQSSCHPKSGLVDVFECACPNSLQISKKLFLRDHGNSEQPNKVLKSFIIIINYCIIIINTNCNYIINSKYNHYISNEGLLEESGKGKKYGSKSSCQNFLLKKKRL